MAEPKWLTKARSYIGLREIPGPKHSSVIVGWLRDLKAWWFEDETPWCGTFVAHCMREAGHPIPKLWFRAKAWAAYGSYMPASAVAPGAILVFTRVGGGHVGFYVGEDTSSYYVLGGNQSNGVNISKLAKTRLAAIRWPTGVPVVGKSVRMVGGKPSTNEA